MNTKLTIHQIITLVKLVSEKAVYLHSINAGAQLDQYQELLKTLCQIQLEILSSPIDQK